MSLTASPVPHTLRPMSAIALRSFRLAITIAFVAGAVIATHWPVLRAQALAQDDGDFVTENPLVTNPGWSSVQRFFGEVLEPSTVRGYYLPLSMTSLMLDWASGGRARNLGAFHRTSLMLHVLNAVLVLFILYRLCGALMPAAAATMLFALHPITVQSLAWISERKTLLAALFAFASMLCYIAQAQRQSRALNIASILFFALALMSKPSVIMLPVLLLILDWWPLRRLGITSVIEKWPYFVLAALSGVITLVSLTRTALAAPPAGFDPIKALLLVCYLPFFYIGKLLWPSELSMIYAPPEPSSLTNPTLILCLIAILVTTLVIVWSLRRSRAYAAGALLFLLALAPTFAVLRWSRLIAYDNYVYFPCIGIALIVAHALTKAEKARGRWVNVAFLMTVAMICMAEARATRSTWMLWRDSITLWQHAVKVSGGDPDAHNGLGVAHTLRMADADALQEFERALKIAPGFAQAQLNAGISSIRLRQIEPATRYLERARQIQPQNPTAEYFLGVALQLSGRLEESEAHYRRALELKPGYTEALDRLGTLLVLQGQKDQGIVLLRQSVAAAPSSAHPHFALATVLLHVGGHDAEARRHLQDAIRYNPEWVEPLEQLAWLEATHPDPALSDAKNALQLVTQALELKQGPDASLLDTRAAALARLGRFDEAIASAQQALALASQVGSDSLARDIEDRLALYERRVAYVHD